MKKELLDHGYLEMIESWGSDEKVVETARVSTNKGFLGWGCKECLRCKSRLLEPDEEGPCPECGIGETILRPGDEKLLRYLYENKHSTPFEFAGATFEIQAPIFVFREWHRHRTQSYSEMSARYSPLPDLNYVPTVGRLMMGGGKNKQASSTGKELSTRDAEIFRAGLSSAYSDLQTDYELALANGVPKELARLLLPMGRYSRMRATANLRNWMQFLTLRQAPNAQFEIRVYADAAAQMLAEKFPRTMALFAEGSK